ncbi:MAG: PH domain-containing protein [Gammaproteobacteria bacterium]|nr:PH domain-containing protein [Gammaproteobacteria bacterium]
MPNETPIFQANLHWIIFGVPICLFVGGVSIDYFLPILHLPALLFMVFGACWLVMTMVTYRFSSVIVQSNQLVLKTGLLVRQTVNIPLTKIESLDIRQPLLGSLLHYGTLIITGTGGTRYSIDNLQHPLSCRRHIEVLLNK